MQNRTELPPIKTAALGLAALLLAACATTPPPPTDALQAAEISIRHATQSRAGDYAMLELASAREKLIAARSAADNQDMSTARKLAEEARADADLATAKSETARAQAANAQVLLSIQSMQQEIQRNSGVRQ